MRAARFFSSSPACFMPSTFCWFGQMITQTLNAMMMPNHMPKPIVAAPATPAGADIALSVIPNARALPRYPSIHATSSPNATVDSAAQRNQNNARGAITLLMAGFCSSGIFGMLGTWTKLK